MPEKEIQSFQIVSQTSRLENEPPIGRFLLQKFDEFQGQIQRDNGDFSWSELRKSPALLAKGTAVLIAYIAIGIPELALSQIKILAKDLHSLATHRHQTSHHQSSNELSPPNDNDL